MVIWTVDMTTDDLEHDLRIVLDDLPRNCPMTRRSRAHLGGIALAALVMLTAAGCADGGDTTGNPADPPDSALAGDATLTGVVFDVYRDPG